MTSVREDIPPSAERSLKVLKRLLDNSGDLAEIIRDEVEKSDGLVTGLAVGTVTISANYDFRTDATMVTVVATSGGGNFVEIEPNNDFPEANDAGLADTFSGQCNEIDDFIDFYVTSGGPVVAGTGGLAFTLTWDEGATFEDIDLVLLDTAGNVVAADQTIPNAMTPDSPAEATAVITTATTIFFVVDCYVTVPTTYTGTITRP